MIMSSYQLRLHSRIQMFLVAGLVALGVLWVLWPAPSPTPAAPVWPAGGEAFLPHYLNQLTGAEPRPVDRCNIQTVAQFVTCDTP